ncbi:MAG: hypothetical protein J6J71_04780 [Prevotella sp.]|nr:hypothetical protein [Prevotella sp.]
MKIDGEWKDFMDCDIVDEIKQDRERIKKTSETHRKWNKNLIMLSSGGFGDIYSPETLLAYWKAQAEAGYPFAEENVRYFEEMVRKNERNGSN